MEWTFEKSGNSGILVVFASISSYPAPFILF